MSRLLVLHLNDAGCELVLDLGEYMVGLAWSGTRSSLWRLANVKRDGTLRCETVCLDCDGL